MILNILGKNKEVYFSIGYVPLGDFILCTVTSTNPALVMNIWIRVSHDMNFYDEIKLLGFKFTEGIFFYDMLYPRTKFATNIKGMNTVRRIKYEIDLSTKELQNHRLSNYQIQNIVLKND